MGVLMCVAPDPHLYLQKRVEEAQDWVLGMPPPGGPWVSGSLAYRGPTAHLFLPLYRVPTPAHTHCHPAPNEKTLENPALLGKHTPSGRLVLGPLQPRAC